MTAADLDMKFQQIKRLADLRLGEQDLYGVIGRLIQEVEVSTVERVLTDLEPENPRAAGDDLFARAMRAYDGEGVHSDGIQAVLKIAREFVITDAVLSDAAYELNEPRPGCDSRAWRIVATAARAAGFEVKEA